MTTRRAKPSFASLLRRAGGGFDDGGDLVEDEEMPVFAPPPAAFEVDPARVRPWPRLGPIRTTPEACAAMLRDGQAAPVVVRPVFDDAHFEYEAIADLPTFAAIRRLREADPALRLLVRVELVDDEGALAIAGDRTDDPPSAEASEAAPAEHLTLAIIEADARSVTFRLTAEEAMTPESLARAVKAMVDGAASDGFEIAWNAEA